MPSKKRDLCKEFIRQPEQHSRSCVLPLKPKIKSVDRSLYLQGEDKGDQTQVSFMDKL